MSAGFGKNSEAPVRPPYKMIARRIGAQLREEFDSPEAEPLPIDHVDLLLRLRQKERERERKET